jgi:hypothetical protein
MTLVTEVVEPLWLGAKMCPKRAGGFGLQGGNACARGGRSGAVAQRWRSAFNRRKPGRVSRGA